MGNKDFDKWNKLKKKLDKSNVKPPEVKEGDIWWSFMGENIGKEISGKGEIFGRPVLIFKKINEITFSCIPLTTSEKVFNEWKYKIDVMDRQSYLYFDQMKTLDYRRLKIKVKEIDGVEFVKIRELFIDLYHRADPLAGVGHRGMRSDASAVALVNSISDDNNMSSKGKHDFNAEALAMHAEHHGKIELKNKVPLATREDLSRAYTPGVAAVCMAIANAQDRHLAARLYTLKRNTVGIVSDGSALLGLGNIGPLAAIPVMEGKAAILKEFACVDAFPICLDTQDTEEIIKAVKQIAPVFGAINLEDIAAPRCFEIEERLRKELNIPVMHDDQWGTATVVLAGVINAIKLYNLKSEDDEKSLISKSNVGAYSLTKENIKVIINGVGSAGVAVGRLLMAYGIKDILFVDSKGLIHKNRTDLNKEKLELINNSVADMLGFFPSPNLGEGARRADEVCTLADAMKGRDIFIGLSKPGTVTADMVRAMNNDPIIFSLANPTPEIMPEEAYAAGAFIVATGRSDYPNQLNNSLIFPGLFKGMLDNDIRQFNINIFMRAALALANHVENLSPENILPNMFDKKLVEAISKSVLS